MNTTLPNILELAGRQDPISNIVFLLMGLVFTYIGIRAYRASMRSASIPLRPYALAQLFLGGASVLFGLVSLGQPGLAPAFQFIVLLPLYQIGGAYLARFVGGILLDEGAAIIARNVYLVFSVLSFGCGVLAVFLGLHLLLYLAVALIGLMVLIFPVAAMLFIGQGIRQPERRPRSWPLGISWLLTSVFGTLLIVLANSKNPVMYASLFVLLGGSQFLALYGVLANTKD